MTSACETIRCRRCGDVIGVYEPMVLLLNDEASVTSAAADRRIPANAHRLHMACFALLNSSPEPTLEGSPPREPAVLDDA